MRKILEACPTCGGALEIREVVCVNCATEVRSHYRPCDFCTLTDEQATFVRLFVLNRGNLSEMEKVLGVSYPTVRAKLDEIAGRLRTPTSATLTAAMATARPLDPAPLPPLSPLAPAPLAPSAQASAGISTARRQILDLVASGRLAAADALVHLRHIAGATDMTAPTASPVQPIARSEDEEVTVTEAEELEQEPAELEREDDTEAMTLDHVESQRDDEHSTAQKSEK